MPPNPTVRRAPPRFVLAETDRDAIALRIDGEPATALAGDTLLVALLNLGRRLRDSEFGDGPRAGFCLMGACQDCWLWTATGERLRACSTVAEAGMAVLTRPPASHWPMTPDLAALREAEAEGETRGESQGKSAREPAP